MEVTNNVSAWDVDVLRTKFSLALSEMYRQEVPRYGDLIQIVRDVDTAVLRAEGQRPEDLPLRNHLERHGAIRLGSEEELQVIKRLFAIFGMHPVGYYDLQVVKFPLSGQSLRNPWPKTHFESLPSEADELITESLKVFKWHSRSMVTIGDYNKLKQEHPLVADIVCFPSAHINHLTPRTLDIEYVQKEMIRRNLPAKERIEGPPVRRCPILLRQTSFKGRDELVNFPTSTGDAVPGTHTARFGEVEQRGAAVTRKGRGLYDELLNTASEQSSGSSRITLDEALVNAFRAYPDTWRELQEKGLKRVPSAIIKKMMKMCNRPATAEKLSGSGSPLHAKNVGPGSESAMGQCRLAADARRGCLFVSIHPSVTNHYSLKRMVQSLRNRLEELEAAEASSQGPDQHACHNDPTVTTEANHVDRQASSPDHEEHAVAVGTEEYPDQWEATFPSGESGIDQALGASAPVEKSRHGFSPSELQRLEELKRPIRQMIDQDENSNEDLLAVTPNQTLSSSGTEAHFLHAVFALASLFEPGCPRRNATRADEFFSRTQDLNFLDVLGDEVDTGLVQLGVLMGFYLQATERFSKCWNVTSLTIGLAQTMGLHLADAQAKKRGFITTPLTQMEYEMRSRVWYGCVVLERYVVPSEINKSRHF
ncbi:hypothetical protein FocTR4_00004304 [Fusarium oxysporum f. sp. cubense]|uniref:2-oxoadipate dioxygenase/decarboxylase n=1 Tax=Fusarium oxysporum f. sp. cubense TaxID=61366 RepID=A0A5C6TDX5_FUSOC|nr:hypothetical protein FocTR4_00004304 [Fusarium oxysporum f. sp. cubense]